MKERIVKRNILGIDLSDVSQNEVLEYVVKSIAENGKKTFIATPNPEMVVYAKKHPEFKKILNEADLAVCDGSGLLVASYILNRPLPARITGVDLMVELCSTASKQALSIGLMGGRGGVAEKATQCLREAFPGLVISFIAEEWSDAGWVDKKKKEMDILFVAFGFPKQEEWIANNLNKIPARVAMGVGGSFDYISGHVARAPFLLRFIGLEWLYRLVKEPWRWRRQIALLEFIWLVFKTRISFRN